MLTSKTVAIFSGLTLAAICAVRFMPAQSLSSAVLMFEPKSAPQFSAFEFGYAELEHADAGRAIFKRAAFKPVQKLRTETVTNYRTEIQTQTVTDSNGQQREQSYTKQVPTQETQQIAYTYNEIIGTQTLVCPFESLTVVNMQGKQLEKEQIRVALRSKCRVIIQMVGTENDAYYTAFLHPETLFVQSDKWVDASITAVQPEQRQTVEYGALAVPQQ